MKKTLLLILIFGAALRFYGLNWDQNQHLHPDERFLTMVTQAISFPKSLSQYFDTSVSSANPHNVGYPFYVYGTLPLFTVKAASLLVDMNTYDGITIVGRFISALLDTLVILLVYHIALIVFKQRRLALISAFVYSLSALSIQLSHFYAVDTYLVFFLALTLFVLLKITSENKGNILKLSILLGLSYGGALASKVTAIYFLPIVIVGFIGNLILNQKYKHIMLLGLIFLVTSLISFRTLQPYLFNGLYHLNPKVVNNWRQLKELDNPNSLYPPGTQWLATKPILFPLENMIYWGWGPVLGALATLSLIVAFRRIKNYPHTGLILLWVLGLFIYHGLQFAKPMRYFYPIYPFLAITTSLLISDIFSHLKKRWQKIIFICLLIYWPLSFISIYSRPNSRVQASTWIYKHIPPGSTLSCEYWDDCLPLGGNGPYRIIDYPLYDPDTNIKWAEMDARLSQTDYLILSSNRLYGSIMTVSDKYPETTTFYTKLFTGKLGFKKIAEFTSRPNLPIPLINICLNPPSIVYGKISYPSQKCPLSGLSFVDDYADESWTVYDHPKVIIFQKVVENQP